MYGLLACFVVMRFICTFICLFIDSAPRPLSRDKHTNTQTENNTRVSMTWLRIITERQFNECKTSRFFGFNWIYFTWFCCCRHRATDCYGQQSQSVGVYRRTEIITQPSLNHNCCSGSRKICKFSNLSSDSQLTFETRENLCFVKHFCQFI